MKRINNYIIEKLQIGSNTKLGDKYSYHPKTIYELEKLIKQLIKERGNEADINDIDTSKITKMESLFLNSTFNGDISNWDVSNVKFMESMFAYSKFNGNIEDWDISKVQNMKFIFDGCPLYIHHKLPKWYKE